MMNARSLMVILCTPAAVLLLTTGCGSKNVLIATGTTLGLKVTPGDGSARPPQVTFAYKRAEIALIPTAGEPARKSVRPNGSAGGDSNASEQAGETTKQNRDAFSTVASFFFSTQWWGDTELASFIATGHAARDLQKAGSTFNQAFAAASLALVSPELLGRQSALVAKVTKMSEARADRALELAGAAKKPGKTAVASLKDAVAETRTLNEVERLESAVLRAPEGA